MGRLLLSTIIDALMMVAAEKWRSGDLSADPMVAALQHWNETNG